MRTCLITLAWLIAATPYAFAQDTFRLDVVPATQDGTETFQQLKAKRDADVLEYLHNTLSTYQPVYFLAGPEDPIAKFQISFKYQIFSAISTIGHDHPWTQAFFVAYSQTSFWDLGAPSAPFFDNSYRPEAFWRKENLFPDHSGRTQVDLQAGFQHESNGRGGDDSRSMNSFYVEPTLWIALGQRWYADFSPRIFAYLNDLEDNPDIKDYRGYADLKFAIGEYDGFKAAFIGRIGEYWDKGSLQVDLSYPLVSGKKTNLLSVHLQVFTGYGETLVEYNKSDTTVRIGISLVQ